MNGFMKGMMLGVVLFAGVNAFYTAEGSCLVEGDVMGVPTDSLEGKREVLENLEIEKKMLLGCRACFEYFIFDSGKSIGKLRKQIKRNEDLIREFDKRDAEFYKKQEESGELSKEDIEENKQGKWDRPGYVDVRGKMEKDNRLRMEYITLRLRRIADRERGIEEIDARIKNIDEEIVKLKNSIDAQKREINE